MAAVVSELRPIGKRFGLTWFVRVTVWDDGDPGEVEFVALETSPIGGSYFVAFDADEGVWFPIEAGGAGPDEWDYAVCEHAFDSPLEAFRAVAAYDREQRRLIGVHEAALRSSGEIGT